MVRYFYIIISFSIALFLISSCNQRKANTNKSVVFDVGFEDLKTHQGIYKNKENGNEEIYFFKANFNPQIKFFNLSGELIDSISLKLIEDKIGRIGRISIISKDSILVVSYYNRIMCGIKRDNTPYFQIDLNALSNQTEENEYRFWGSFFPNPIFIRDNVIFITTWDGKHKGNEPDFASQLEYYKYILENRMYAPMLCKVESIFSSSPKMKFALRGFYHNRSDSLKSFGGSDKEYALLNNQLFFISVHDRNIYKLNVSNLEIIDTIPVIPEEYQIPQGIYFANDINVSEDMLAEQEIAEKCRITNMLYHKEKQKYYIFVRIAKDISSVDELGYPFKIFIYDEKFKKEKEITFNTNKYNPKSIIITSKGILIEKNKEKEQYGKRIFEFLDI